jgi:hypothetical protein
MKHTISQNQDVIASFIFMSNAETQPLMFPAEGDTGVEDLNVAPQV